MPYSEYYNAADNTDFSVTSEDVKKMAEKLKKSDRGYNSIWRMVEKNNRLKRTKIEVYSSNGHETFIRNAETGERYGHLVGSADEDLYFSVILATGECNSANGSSTLFFLSPQHYMTHMHCNVDDKTIMQWSAKREARLKSVNVTKKQSVSSVVVK